MQHYLALVHMSIFVSKSFSRHSALTRVLRGLFRDAPQDEGSVQPALGLLTQQLEGDRVGHAKLPIVECQLKVRQIKREVDAPAATWASQGAREAAARTCMQGVLPYRGLFVGMPADADRRNLKLSENWTTWSTRFSPSPLDGRGAAALEDAAAVRARAAALLEELGEGLEGLLKARCGAVRALTEGLERVPRRLGREEELPPAFYHLTRSGPPAHSLKLFGRQLCSAVVVASFLLLCFQLTYEFEDSLLSEGSRGALSLLLQELQQLLLLGGTGECRAADLLACSAASSVGPMRRPWDAQGHRCQCDLWRRRCPSQPAP
eukprot:scaffold1437_cov353-Prasinococcus_capsulatus_cf.AAC.11